MNKRNGLIVTISVCVLAALMGCGQRAGDAELQESKEAKQLLQGVWSDEDAETVVFQMRGDSVYYPDTTSIPAYFRVYNDTLYIGSSARYHEILDRAEIPPDCVRIRSGAKRAEVVVVGLSLQEYVPPVDLESALLRKRDIAESEANLAAIKELPRSPFPIPRSPFPQFNNE